MRDCNLTPKNNVCEILVKSKFLLSSYRPRSVVESNKLFFVGENLIIRKLSFPASTCTYSIKYKPIKDWYLIFPLEYQNTKVQPPC